MCCAWVAPGLAGWLVLLLSRPVSFLSSPLKNRQLNVGFALSFPEKPLLLSAKLRPQRVFALWVLVSSLLLQHPRQSGHPRGDCCVCQGGERWLLTTLPFGSQHFEAKSLYFTPMHRSLSAELLTQHH